MTALHVALIITPVAIVYVLFLLVSLTTGSKTSEDVVDNSVIKTRPSLDLNGSLITKSKDGAVDEIMFHVTNALGGMIDLSPDTTFASYTDPDQSLTFTGSELTVTGLRTANSDNLVEKGDLYEIRLTDLRENWSRTLQEQGPLQFSYSRSARDLSISRDSHRPPSMLSTTLARVRPEARDRMLLLPARRTVLVRRTRSRW